MNSPEQSNFSDALWRSFDIQEQARGIEVDVGYALIEEENLRLLRQVAGEDSLNGTEYAHPPYELTLNEQGVARQSYPTMAKLFLRPDIERKLIEQGEPPDQAYANGNPYVIEGEFPVQTVEMLNRLLVVTRATFERSWSDEETRVWRGNVAEKPIRFEQISMRKTISETGVEIPVTTSIWVHREQNRARQELDIVPNSSKFKKWFRAHKKHRIQSTLEDQI